MKRSATITLVLLALVAAFAVGVQAQSASCTFYVAINGSSSGNGSFANPWDLLTVWHGDPNSAGGVAPPASIHPGDTVCLRGGTYSGSYQSILLGTTNSQIVVKSYPGEHAIIDPGSISINGGYMTVRDIELFNSNTFRTDYRTGGFFVNAPGIQIINNIIHDGGVGIASSASGSDDLFYGNLIYNVGWDDRLTGHQQGGTGPCTYLQNQTGYKRFYNNICATGFGLGFSAYTAGNAAVTGFDVQNNISYNFGYWTRYHDSSYATEGRAQDNLLFGSSSGAQLASLIVSGNISYHREQRGADNLTVGYGGAENISATVTNNTSIGGDVVLSKFETLNASGNKIISNFEPMTHRPPVTPVSEVINNNTYYYYGNNGNCNANYLSNDLGQTYLTVTQWKALGYDAASTFNPCGVRPPVSVTIIPNAYDVNRAHLAISNLASSATVSVNLGSFLNSGDTFEIHNAQDYFGPLVASGTYNGPVTVNMTNCTVAVPVGYDATSMTPMNLMTSCPQFGAFVVLRNSGAPATQPLTSPPTGVTALASNNQVQLSWSALSGATTYKVKRGTASGVYTVTFSGIAGTSYLDVSAVNGQQYFYVVVGTNSVGDSPNSTEVTATPTSGVPAAPTNLVMTNTSTSAQITTTDSFTDTDGTDLRNHVGELGASWTQPTYSAGPKDFIYSNRVTREAVGFRGIYYSSGTPATNSYVQATFTVLSTTGIAGLVGRLDPNSENWYNIQYDFSTGQWSINSDLNSSTSQLTSWPQTLSINDTLTVRLETVGSTETAYINGIAHSVSNADHPSAGRAGILYIGAASSTTGMAIDNFEAGTLGSSSITATYQDNSNNESGFSLLRGVGASPSSFVQVASGGPNVTSLIDSTAQANTLYSYYVVAFNANGNSTPTATVTNTSVPATPTNLSAAVVSSSQINLTWTSGASQFSVEQCAGLSCSNFVEVATPATNSVSITGLAANSPFSFRVRAKNVAGYSAYSNTASATTFPVPTPSAPASPAAAAGNTTISLTWTATANTVNYKVFRRTASGVYNFSTPIAQPTTNSYVDTGLTNGNQYLYVIEASNASGDSPNSAEVNATPVAPVVVPSAPTGVLATAGDSKVVVTWNAVGAAATYKVKRGTTSGVYTITYSGITSPTYTDSTTVNGTQYFFVVEGTNSAGDSANSSEVNATPAGVPATPTGLIPTVTSGQVVLNWAAAAGATSYKVFRAATSGGYNYAAALGTPAGTTYTDNTVVNGTVYWYVVRGVDAAGDSLSSNEVSASPPIVVTPPTVLAVLAKTENSITLTWTNGTAYDSVRIESCAGANCLVFTEQTFVGNVTTFNDTSLPSSATKQYRIRGKIGSSFSNYSNVVAGTTTVATPTSLVATAINPSQINLTWLPNSQGPALISTCIERKLTVGGTFAQMACSGSILSTFQDQSVLPSTDYSYRLQNLDANGPGLYSATANAVTPAPAATVPGTPLNLVCSRNSAISISCSWTLGDPRNETSVILEQSTDNVNWTQTVSAAAGTQGYAIINMATRTTFFFRVRGSNATGAGANSNIASATTTLLCTWDYPGRCR